MKINQLFFFNKKKNNSAKKQHPELIHYNKITSNFLQKLENIKDLNINYTKDSPLNFIHSGNCGDIIYAIPSIYAIAKDKKPNLFIQIDQPAIYPVYFEQHPMGNVMVTRKTAEMLIPLLEYQNTFNFAGIYTDDITVDVNLDLIRQSPLHLEKGNIARWYFQVFGVNYDLNKNWLNAPMDQDSSEAIVIARSSRYNSPGISYSFLKKYSNVQFVGTEKEYLTMREMILNLKYRPVKDFLELASVIKGSKLFIGNQSFPFSIAEGLKVNRVLEVYFDCPNVNVYGDNGYDFYFQNQFEKIVKERYELL